ncbi:MAG TPA: hypothetical protein VIF57_24825 [Polyangia bacterium]|jgi:hypothetical protein
MRSTANRSFRTGPGQGARATALALAGLLSGGGVQTSQAAEPAAKKELSSREKAALIKAMPPPPPLTEVAVIDGGKVTGTMSPDEARKNGYTIVDLSDDWLPYVFSETQEKPQPLRPFLLNLANGRYGSGKMYARPHEDKFFEVFGIFPSLNLVRRRLADKKRHACHDRVKDGVLEELSAKNVIPPEEAEKVPNPNKEAVAKGDEPAMIPTGKTVSPRPLTEQEHRAVIAMQAHLRCEDMLSGKAIPGRMDRRTAEGLKVYQHLHQLADSSKIDLDTRTVLLGDSREADFKLLLRVLRERVVDATGLLEDGSAVGAQGEVQGRVLDSPEFQPLAAPAEKKEASPATAGAGAAQGAQTTAAQGAQAQSKPVPAVDTSAKIVPATDLIAPATQAASQALGWTSPDAALANTLPPPAPAPGSKKARKPPALKKGQPATLPVAVAIKLPPLPSYYNSKMELRAEIDRGEVVLARPKFDKDGHKKWKPPVADRPTLTLYAKAGDHEVALCRWPTTIGGWKTFEKKDGTMALKYKDSVTGDAVWPEVLATPTWHPAPGMPTRKLLIKVGDSFQPKTEIIGPGYRAAYGLVAIVHHQIMGKNDKGEPELMDLRIRTHGTPGYRSVKRGESNGCHRLHNFEALRLSAFLIKHHENVREGLVPEDYVRNLSYKGQTVALESESKGYRFKLTPPVPVTVLEGDVKGDPKAVKRMVPLAAVP